MLDTQAAETPLCDHVARFWRLLETETVRICLDLKRVVGAEASDGPVTYWDGSTFPDDVAKALIAERERLQNRVAELERVKEQLCDANADMADGIASL